MAELPTGCAPRVSQTGGPQQPFGTRAAHGEGVPDAHDLDAVMRRGPLLTRGDRGKEMHGQRAQRLSSGASNPIHERTE